MDIKEPLDNNAFYGLSVLLDKLKAKNIVPDPETIVVLLGLLAQIPLEGRAEQAKGLLRPLICKNEHQQRIFDNLWDEMLLLNREPEYQQILDADIEDKKTSVKKLWLHAIDRIRKAIVQLKQIIQKCFENLYAKPTEEKHALIHDEELLAKSVLPVYAENLMPELPAQLQDIAVKLRSRETVETHFLDIRKTIYASIGNQGLYTPIKKMQARHIEFVILTQQYNKADHRAALFDVFVDELLYRNVPLQRYFFSADPRLCFNEQNLSGKRLETILQQSGGAYLIVLADSLTFFEPQTGDLQVWATKILKHFSQTLLLTNEYDRFPKNHSRKLKEIFSHIFPLTVQGLSEMQMAISRNGNYQTSAKLSLPNSQFDTSPVFVDSEDDIPRLAFYFDKHILQWIAAIAVFPAFSWNLTLLMGKLLSTNDNNLLNWQNLQQLNRISWFANGFLPEAHALKIIEQQWISQAQTASLKKAINHHIRSTIELYNSNAKEIQLVTRILYHSKELLDQLGQKVLATDAVFSKILQTAHLKMLRILELEPDIIEKLQFGMQAAQTTDEQENNVFSNFTETATGVSFEMVAIKGGTFRISSDANEGNETSPPYDITLKDFYMGQTEVTIGEYLIFCKASNQHWPEWLEKGSSYYIYGNGKEKNYYKTIGMAEENTEHPITGVSWDDAKAYCAWLSQKTGKNYRLPSEAEWEYAAGGGALNRTKWAGTNDESSLGEYAVYSSNSGSKTASVKSKKPNALGLYDMSGNVWEWCEDDYHANYNGIPKDGSAWVDNPRSSLRVYRGGGWSDDAGLCRVSIRGYYFPNYRNYFLGFRVVLSF